MLTKYKCSVRMILELRKGNKLNYKALKNKNKFLKSVDKLF